ncbi:toxic anion resistance protein [Acinetobacter qingfengensis]|uniref:Tellurium resistance protein n=1 Tax=Acinetobacter qingfengensis TaxID=1262585 RepID=A0A1E7RDJ9_9GAMM|nr:toxic anion resistance protein [Acinetobacter qingfengensis]KAA8735343.1 toxic anion resistance protein [Acinetobacter qingfengensis]OEY97332.1 tellurium resistance protein [Acinetobacter qingfengensis]
MSKQNTLTTPSDSGMTEQQFQQLDLKALGLNDKDYAAVLQVSQELDDIDQTRVAEYGKNIATQTSTYTDDLLQLVQSKDLDETGQKLNQVVNAAQQLNSKHLLAEQRKSGFLGSIFSKFKQAKQTFQVQFHNAKEQIDHLIQEIEISQTGLKQRVEMLDKMFAAVQQEQHTLGIYIAAGQLKQQQLAQQISALTVQEQDQHIVQQIYDLNHAANNLEKRVHDLKMLQQSALQTLPMIRIIQSNNLMLVDKFYAIKNITIPAWKNQISLALSLNEQKHSVELADSIDNATNELLRKNAELLHSNSVNTAKANQRAVIDIDTLEHVQNTLIKTVNDVIQIQKEGMEKRVQATEKLKSLQGNLNQLVVETAKPK